MKQVGSVSFLREYRGKIHPETVFVFDLELPETFSPGNTDGEVETFTLVPVEEVRSLICSEENFKISSSLVALDWLIRNGLVFGRFHKPLSGKSFRGLSSEMVKNRVNTWVFRDNCE